MMLTDNANVTDAKKKALLQAVGGVDMIWLFEHHGKVVDTDMYVRAVEKIKTALEGQTNQASIRHTLFTKMPQGEKPFAMWWSEVKEQSEKCSFDGYDSKMACRDAIVYQTSSNKLRKRVLNEDLNLEATVKLGLMEEQSEMKAESWKKMLRGYKPRVWLEVEKGRRKGVRPVLEEISTREDLVREERRKSVFRVARRVILKGHQSVKKECQRRVK